MKDKKKLFEGLLKKYDDARLIQYALDKKDKREQLEFDLIYHLLFNAGVDILAIHRLSRPVQDILASPETPEEERIAFLLFEYGITLDELICLAALGPRAERSDVISALIKLIENYEV